MKLSEAPRYINMLMNAGVSIELIGPPGIGKTAIVRQIVAANSTRDGFAWGYAEAQLTNYTPVDVAGFMIPTKDANGAPVATFTKPAFFLTKDGRPIEEFKRSVVFFDEIGQADPDVKKAASTVILEHRVGNHRLPDGAAVIAASNRGKDRSGVTKSYDHMVNRRCELVIEPDLGSWLDWAIGAGIRPEFTAFAEHNFDLVFSGEVPDKPGAPWCTPRSLHLLSDTLTHGLDDDAPLPDDPGIVEMAQGLVGDAAPQIFATIRLRNQLPAYDDILARPDTAHLPDKPDAVMLTLHLLAAKVKTATMDPVLTYLRRLPGEFAVPFGTMALRRNSDLVNSSAFSKWAMEHSAMTQAITAARR